MGNISKWLQVAPTLFHEVKPGFAEGAFYSFPMGNPPFGESIKESGWWFGTFFIFHNIWDVILPIDFHIFQMG